MRLVRAIVLGGLAALAVHMATAPRATAEGALVVGLTDNLRDGSAFGYAVNRRSRDRAANRAMQECRNVRVASQRVKANCRVVGTFRRECIAISLTPQAPGFGFAFALDKITAEDRAIAACQLTAGNGRQHLCKVDASICDVDEQYDD
jgi:hypothetical protein